MLYPAYEKGWKRKYHSEIRLLWTVKIGSELVQDLEGLWMVGIRVGEVWALHVITCSTRYIDVRGGRLWLYEEGLEESRAAQQRGSSGWRSLP